MISMFSNKRIWFYILSIGLVLCSATLQGQHMFGVLGIRPNLVLVSLITLAFFINEALLFLLLIILGTIGVSFGSGVSLEAVALAVVVLGAFLTKERVIWPGVFATGILIFFGTFILYAILSSSFIYNHLGTVFFEAMYNVALGVVSYEMLSFYVKKIQLTI